VTFIIKEENYVDFKESIGKRIESKIKTKYAFQKVEDIPTSFKLTVNRSKPWGTAHAILAARNIIEDNFVIINADDYYGKEAFVKIHDFLISDHKENEYCMAGFILKNTLSDNGGVTRGICQVENGKLKDVVETHDIIKTKTGASSHGADIDVNSHVSMNMWGLTPAFMDLLEEGFKSFFNALEDPLKGEYLIPVYIGELLRDNKVTVDVLETKDKWFGVTYKEDKETVVNSFKQLYNNGVYNEDLFSDL
jgi:dTDP-glucose pyrophosphorylase